MQSRDLSVDQIAIKIEALRLHIEDIVKEAIHLARKKSENNDISIERWVRRLNEWPVS